MTSFINIWLEFGHPTLRETIAFVPLGDNHLKPIMRILAQVIQLNKYNRRLLQVSGLGQDKGYWSQLGTYIISLKTLA